MLLHQLSYPHNIKKGATNEQISKVITCVMALPIPYRLDTEISISGVERPS